MARPRGSDEGKKWGLGGTGAFYLALGLDPKDELNITLQNEGCWCCLKAAGKRNGWIFGQRVHTGLRG